MGGKALKVAKTRRYSKDEYFAILPEILEKAKTLFTDARATTAYREKDSFGDADILCLIDNQINIDIKQWIIDTYGATEVYKNSHVYSFDYHELQVDFILTPISKWESSLTYFSYNDIHNLIGKLFHRFGLKWGYDGLKYQYNIDGKRLGTIYLTTDYHEAFKLVDLDPNVYEKGFDNLEQIFEYVKSSKYYNPWIFDLENLNKVNRDRDKKRNTYAKFIDYIEKDKNVDKSHYYYFYKDKKVYLGLIDFYFSGFLKEYRELEKKETRKRAIHEKFNGNLIIEQFNITGKELGQAITKFKSSFNDLNEQEQYILDNNIETILERFKMINKLN